jgi:hypothetical protein
MNYYKQLYFTLLPIPLGLSSIFGIINGTESSIKQKDPIKRFSVMIGYSSLGIITGVIYPISFPFLAGYTLFQKHE